MLKDADTKQKIRDNSIMIINNIAFMVCKSNQVTRLVVTDLNNLKYRADFVFDRSMHKFRQVKSSFSDGKRKYEMLYLTERNMNELLEAYNNA